MCMTTRPYMCARVSREADDQFKKIVKNRGDYEESHATWIKTKYEPGL